MFCNKFATKYLLVFVLSVAAINAHAQQYPVQGALAINGPYPAYLSDYANANIEKLLLNLTLTDLNISNKRVKLKLFIQKQNSVIAQSIDNINGETTIILDGGVPQRFTSIELANYFKIENLSPLQGLGADAYSQPLPEGVYNIGFEVYDYFTGNKLSGRISQMFWLMLNDPPLLNMPRNRENIVETKANNPQIVFQWTPRSTQVTNTEYEFTLSELWDDSGDPYQQFMAAIPKFQTTASNTSLLYGIAEPPLLAGRTYAWRVQAKAKAGFEDIGMYRQNGYSEIFVFKYGGQCATVQGVNIEVKGYDRVYVTWQPSLPPSGGDGGGPYKVVYRKYSAGGTWEWHETETVDAFFNLFDLQANTGYEIKVGGVCHPSSGGGAALVSYSNPQTVKTLQSGQITNINCGQAPAINIANQTLLQRLNANEVVMAGDFPITITKAEGGGGGFSGEGWAKVPWLADTKIKVTYTGIKVNTEYKLLDGFFETTYDPSGKNIGDVDELVEDVKGLVNDIADLVKTTIDKDYKAMKELKESVEKMIEEELPESLKQEMTTAINTMDETKKTYDTAKQEYDAAKTPEEKQAAKEKMEKTEEGYKTAQEKVQAVMKENDELVKGVSEIILAAIKRLKKERETLIAGVSVFNADVEKFKKQLNEEQGITTTPASEKAGEQLVYLGTYEEDMPYVDQKRQAFLQQSAELLKRRKGIKAAVVYKVFIDYFSTEQQVSDKFISDQKIAGKKLVDQLIDKQSKSETKENMIQFSFDYLEAALQEYISSLK